MPVSASDLEREKRLASEIVDSIMDGDAEFLSAGDYEFLAIYTEADEPNRESVGLWMREGDVQPR